MTISEFQLSVYNVWIWQYMYAFTMCRVLFLIHVFTSIYGEWEWKETLEAPTSNSSRFRVVDSCWELFDHPPLICCLICVDPPGKAIIFLSLQRSMVKLGEVTVEARCTRYGLDCSGCPLSIPLYLLMLTSWDFHLFLLASSISFYWMILCWRILASEVRT